MRIYLTTPPTERFWKQINKTDDCWLWVGSTKKGSYGHLEVNGKLIYAHRYSWELNRGKIPNGFWVLHKCDNPPCVKPDHLFLGNQKDNMHDASIKGRTASGENHGRSKLTKNQVEEIRKRYVPHKYGFKKLAKYYGVKPQAICKIIFKKRWKNI